MHNMILPQLMYIQILNIDVSQLLYNTCYND